MVLPDLNLLIALDVLLSEGSVVRAARRLRLSPSAMSRTLARLRQATGDQLLVRAGRSLVPTPHALALKDRAGAVLGAAVDLLRPEAPPDPGQFRRDLTLGTGDGFVETFGPALIRRLADEAPGIRLAFVPRADRVGGALRDGAVDLETGTVDVRAYPELRVQVLFHDRFVGVVRPDHLLARGAVSAAAYAACDHVRVSRKGFDRGRIDESLAALGLERRFKVAVGGFAAALSLVRSSDLVATVPERHTAGLKGGLVTFALPVASPDVAVSMVWHPRQDGDPGHRWLRGVIREVVGDVSARG